EPTGCLELRLEPRKSLVQGAHARKTEGFDIELKLATGLVDRSDCPQLDLQSIAEGESRKLGLVTEVHAANLGVCVLEIEVAVSRRSAREIRDLAPDPDEAELAFQNEPGGAHELRYGHHDRIADRFDGMLTRRIRSGPGRTQEIQRGG